MEGREPLANIAGDPMSPSDDPMEYKGSELLVEQAEDVVLAALTVRERRVMLMLYGLDGGGVRTQVAIGRELRVSPRTVGRDILSLVAKLRHPSSLRTLKDYLVEEP